MRKDNGAGGIKIKLFLIIMAIFVFITVMSVCLVRFPEANAYFYARVESGPHDEPE